MARILQLSFLLSDIVKLLNKDDSKGGGIMTIEVIRSALAWCTVINWGLLLWWFLFFTLAHDWIYRFHSKWIDLSVDKFDAIHYAGMALFKIGIFLFNLVPYFALRIVG
jgi:hypothetical protein